MKIIRIERLKEDGEYVGMYKGLASLLEEKMEISFASYKTIFEDHYRHPVPWSDPGLGYGWEPSMIFGFHSYFCLSNWMTVEMLSTLAQLGDFYIKVYEVGSKNVKCGHTQCVFDPEEAQCIFVGGINKDYFNLLDIVKGVVS